MTPEEVAALLKQIAARDNRRTGPETIAAWLEDLDGLTFDDCREAVRRHFRESTDWITAAHVRRLVRDIRDDRLKDSDRIIPEGDPNDREAWAQSLRNITNRLANGREPFRAIEGGKGKSTPNEAFRKARTADDRARVLGQTIACPVPWCSALVGQPCVSQVHGKPLAKGHPSRVKAARSEAS